MKRWIRTLCLVLALVCIGTVLAGCAKTLSGTYKADVFGSGVSYTFKGKDVTVNVLVGDGTITLTFGDADAAEAKSYSGTFDFAETENSIKIGLMEYTLVEE